MKNEKAKIRRGMGVMGIDPAQAATWLRIPTAARLIDLSPGALRKRLARLPVPAGIVVRFGSSVLIHRERFLAWIGSSTPVEAPRGTRKAS